MPTVTEKPVLYGGQAVVEGVMFGGKHVQVTAVRRKNGEIELFESFVKTSPWMSTLKKIPLVRGIVTLIEASASGAKHLQFASERYEMDDEESDPPEVPSSGSNVGTILGVAAVGILSLVIGKVIFTAVPAFLASLILDRWTKNLIIQNLFEGGIKVLFLLTYLWAISQTPLIKRLFQYHGAEHKVITSWESGEELTVRNVQKHSTLHYRCGSSFIILSVIVGVLVYSWFPYESVWDRILTRLLLIPVVIGISFELLRATNAVKDNPYLAWLGLPGLWLQKLTTKEPTDDQVEVAIAAFRRMRELDLQAETDSVVRQPTLAHSS